MSTALCATHASLSLFFISRKKSPRDQRSPPGNTGWPFIGESLEYVTSGRNDTPIKRMDKFSPEVFKTSIAGETVAVFCGASGNKFLFSNENKLVGSWWPPTIDKIITAKNSKINVTLQMRKLRRILPEFLKPEALQKYVPIMDRMATQHLERDWSGASNKQVKAFTLAKKFTFEIACRLFMSVEDSDEFRKPFGLVAAGLFGVPINLPGTTFNRAIKAADRIRYELLPILKERRRQPNEKLDMGTRDLVSHLLLSADEDGNFPTEMQVADNILGILFASHDTVTTAIAFVVYYLADHPDVYAQVFKDHPGHLLVPIKLNGTNYPSWSKSMIHALTAKNKIGFINGSIEQPSEKDRPTEYALWNQCNSMILSWLTHSVEPDLAKGVIHAKTAYQVWEDFKDQ
ncbi:LOW QUALITY PROTEIN: hypothetical protein RJ639_019741 [Escallonia herrerae]|uniref:Cytochrome P450 n=1 Tax=Escallonia herrerae TaxID=1293975 RepID=A0AA88V698_9ASTE|nr:LOW QUALITY PROTEIN: hypothetical protein RJ639_019741 [Escallonia herrerae]